MSNDMIPNPPVPDPLMTADGRPVAGPDAWWSTRRPELRRLFETHVYGRAPAAPPLDATREVDDVESDDGRAVLRQVAIHIRHGGGGKRVLHLLVWLPAQRAGRVPVLLGLNFHGNHSTCHEKAVVLPTPWMPGRSEGVVDNRATDAGRGTAAARWPVSVALERGFGVATLYHGDVDPDRDDFSDGVHPLYYGAGQMRPDSDEWGTLAAWAWGLSRAMDYLATDPDVDARRVGVLGHSRNGKAALLAAALDERFALAISNQSGCGGAALFRGKQGERIADINRQFPHWFCAEFKPYGGREEDLPVDQHLLISMIAPRPVLVCSAQDDTWADPAAELAGLCGAEPVYRMLGTDGTGGQLDPMTPPPLNTLAGAILSYHCRPGGHGVGKDDWTVFAEFAGRVLR